MPTSVEHAESMTFAIISSCFWISITILTPDQSYKIYSSQIIGFLDYLLARITCGKSSVPNTQLILKSDRFSTLENGITCYFFIIEALFYFWFDILSNKNSKKEHEQKDSGNRYTYFFIVHSVDYHLKVRWLAFVPQEWGDKVQRLSSNFWFFPYILQIQQSLELLSIWYSQLFNCLFLLSKIEFPWCYGLLQEYSLSTQLLGYRFSLASSGFGDCSL